MALTYLVPGQQIILHGGPIHVGRSATFVDALIDWRSMEDYSDNEGIGVVIATGTRPDLPTPKELTFNVFVDETSGRFYFDDEHGR